MQSFQDNSRFVTMINNRPNVSIVPPVNKRILAQKVGLTGFMLFGTFTVMSLISYKYFLDISSLYLVKTKKAFTFDSDPYSGKVKCNYTEVPNKQYGL